MEKDEFKAMVARLREVNEVVKPLDEALRGEAVRVLLPYATGGAPAPPADPDGGGSDGGDGGGDIRQRLLAERGDGKPSDNALMCAAIWFAEQGKDPFNFDQLRDLASELGITIPARLDMTIGNAKRDGKKLFKSKGGRGSYAPTTHGETVLKTTFGVKQGRGSGAA